MDCADAVVHLAARPSVTRSLEDPVASHQANATGSLNVLEACRRRSVYLVLASSSSVYGSVEALPKHEELATRPLSPYAASKLAAEAYLLAYQAAFGLPGLALRFFNVYGPLQTAGHAYAAAIPAFIDSAMRSKPVIIHGDGRQTRDFTFVGTVVKVLADAVRYRVSNPEPVNLAFGTRTPIIDVAQRVAAAVGVPADIRHGPARPGDVRDSQASCDRLRSLFPAVSPVALDEGLERTVAWFRQLEGYAEDHRHPLGDQAGVQSVPRDHPIVVSFLTLSSTPEPGVGKWSVLVAAADSPLGNLATQHSSNNLAFDPYGPPSLIHRRSTLGPSQRFRVSKR